MKTLLAIASTIGIFIGANTANAQFDFGRVIKGEAKQMFRKIENGVRQKVREELKSLPFKPPVQTLPIKPPVQTLPYKPPKPVLLPKCPPPSSTPVVKPAPKPQPKPESKLPEVELGSVVSIDGKGFGEEPGGVFVKIDSLVLESDLIDWNDELAEAKLPRIPIVEAAKATVFVLNAKGDIAEKMEVVVTPPTEEPEPIEEEAEEVEELPVVHSGQEVTLEGELGEKQGRVEIRIGILKLRADVSEWKSTETTLKLPEVEMAEPQPATIVVLGADGKIVEQIEVQYSGKSE